jgi:ABC-type uncharacterized transport system fused permease/ATPase subunit
LRISGFGARPVTERRFASLLIVALVLINQLQVGIHIRLSFFNRDWFNSIQNKDSAAFWSLLFIYGMTQNVTDVPCRLCGATKELQDSHILPGR